MPFWKGQKVVYIGPDFRENPAAVVFRIQVPVPGEIYTTRSGLLYWNAAEGYLLEEIVNPHVRAPGLDQEMLIEAKWLRPLVAGKDQAFFTTGAPSGTKWFDNRRKDKQKGFHAHIESIVWHHRTS